MAEKKIQENPIPEEPMEPTEKPKDMSVKTVPDKAITVPIPAPESARSPRLSIPAFTKPPPNDLYRRLLPAVLFLLTFVTVMTMLLIYMDTVALGAQQFRLNMSRDYELARIGQRSAPLVQYVRQVHLAPRAQRPAPPAPSDTPRAAVLRDRLGDVYNGTFVEFMARGPREPTTQYLEAARHWSGVVVRAAPRDYLALRGAARALHACLSPTEHPREVSYHEDESHETAFSSRVLCLPLYTVLAAADATRAQYVLLASEAVPPALTHLPFEDVTLKIIEVFSTDPGSRNKVTTFLETKNYTVAATFDDSVMYALKGTQA